MKLWMIGTGLLIGVAISTESARAEPPGKFGLFRGGAPMMRPMMGFEGVGPILPMILRHADLTPEQHEKIREILSGDRETLRQLFERLERANQELSARLFGVNELTLGDLESQISEIGKARRGLLEQGVKTTLAIRSVLTPEQLTKVIELQQRIDRLQAEMQELMGPRPD